jgi:class 3 adenylate cyclase
MVRMGTDAPDQTQRIDEARRAVELRDWPLAYELLRGAPVSELSPEDLEGLAKASWWTGHPVASIEARERAYARYVEGGDTDRAAQMALTLRREQASMQNGSAATGWLRRAERLLEGRTGTTVASGYLALAHGEIARDRGEFEQALGHFDEAIEIAGRVDDRDLAIWAAMRRGMTFVAMGRLDEGWELMEESSVAAVGGELGAYTTGAVFCNVISTSRDLADYRRASEWSEAAKRWCDRQSITGFPGICRVRRAEVLRLLGSWREAMDEATQACAELRDFSPVFAGEAFAELGEVRLRVGEFDGAEEAFRQAHGFGVDAQPGLAMLQLARGKPDAAASAISRRLGETEGDPLTRARLLPAQAEIALTRNDPAAATAAAEEMAEIAREYPTTAIRAGAEWTAGIAARLGGDLSEAIARLRRAAQLWREVGAPYETATTRIVLAEAYEADGDVEAARLEADAARTTLVELGAVPLGERADRFLERLRGGGQPRRAVRTFMFTDIVGSTALLEAIGDEAWEDVRRWHDEALRTCFARHDGEEINQAGDGFFVAFPDPASGVACAIEIQRVLVEHRREHGFAPQVRVGLHATEATETEDTFAGRGVHEAARIGALANGAEILASEETVRDVPDVEVSTPREVTLKGISKPVQVVAVEWRTR